MTNRVRKYAGGNLFSGPWRPRNGVQVYAGGEPIRSQYPSIQHTSTDAAWTATLKGPSGEYITFDWGDGSAPTTLELATGGVDFVHDYSSAGAGTKVVRIYGDLDSVTFFRAISNDIFSIQNFKFRNATAIYLFTNNIVDISALSQLVSITNLEIHENNISNITPLAGLTELVALWIRDNTISNISALSNMSELTSTNMSSNQITNISPVVSLDKLTYLSLKNNPVDYPLAGLSWFTATSGTFRFDSTVDSSAEVDQWLIDLAAADWATCTVYLNGTNPARTSASDAAVVALVLAGVTLHLN